MTAPIEVNQTKLQRTLWSQRAMVAGRYDDGTGGGTGGGAAAERGIRAASLDMEYGDLDLDNGDDGTRDPPLTHTSAPPPPLTQIWSLSPSHTHPFTPPPSPPPPRPHTSRFTLHTHSSLLSGLN